MAGEPQRRGSGPLQDVIERLTGAGFQLLPAFDIATHYVVERGGFAALVERLPDGGFGQIGSPGLLTGEAFAMLVSKKDGPVFVSKGREEAASAQQVDELRRFDRDLKEAISRQQK